MSAPQRKSSNTNLTVNSIEGEYLKIDQKEDLPKKKKVEYNQTSNELNSKLKIITYSLFISDKKLDISNPSNIEIPCQKNILSSFNLQTSCSQDFLPLDVSDNKKFNIISMLDKYDKFYSEKLFNLETNRFIESFIFLGGRMYNAEWTILYLILILLYSLLIEKNIFLFINPTITTILCLLITLTSKYLIGRRRPSIKDNIKRRHNLRSRESTNSMPSGDSLQAANFASILYLYFNSYLGFLFVPLVMVGRVFYFCHYLLDTVAGVLVGFTVSISSYYLIILVEKKLCIFSK